MSDEQGWPWVLDEIPVEEKQENRVAGRLQSLESGREYPPFARMKSSGRLSSDDMARLAMRRGRFDTWHNRGQALDVSEEFLEMEGTQAREEVCESD